MGPARAGVFPLIWPVDESMVSGPRTGGGVPVTLPAVAVTSEWAPHGRGCSVNPHQPEHQAGVGPARAGVFPQHAGEDNQAMSGPRTGGGVP